MKPDGKPERLKTLFCGLKREDERRAPAFSQVWQAATARQRKAPPRTPWAIAGAAAAVILPMAVGAVLVGYRPWERQSVSPAPPIVEMPVLQAPQPGELEITRWESPTAFLLEPPAGPSTGGGSV
jgi:hypothetical protein